MGKNKIFALIYALIGFLIILIPSYIVPVCPSSMMGCRARTLPVLVLLGIITIIIAAIEFLLDK